MFYMADEMGFDGEKSKAKKFIKSMEKLGKALKGAKNSFVYGNSLPDGGGLEFC